MDIHTLLVSILAVILVTLSPVESTPQLERRCLPFANGSFVIHQHQLYPDCADWDVDNCVIYFGSKANASVIVYDPYMNKIVNILMLSDITNNPNLQIGGVRVDPHTKLVSIVANAAAPFSTGGQDVSGDSFIIKYDAAKEQVLWSKNITTISKGEYAGFRDIGYDSNGNTYVVGTFPGTIMKVNREGSDIIPWYLPAKIDHTKTGFSGLAAAGNVLLTSNNEDSQIYRFDMTADKGSPVLVRRSPDATLAMTGAIYLPPRYDGKVLLVAENAKGITVLRSSDGSWQLAEHLGTVPNNSSAAQGGTITAAVQVGDSLYMVEGFSPDPPVSNSAAGNRTEFPMVDITLEVEGLLNK
ncbi:uncharacterized protein LY79DRAFT_704889 [Colletotrichum navitas]|uniref:Tri14-like protein n=1 Tax=Colletotrichum navitas TaxID=681940 RepID=A0AAD8PV26_9PEZI|nr:uncharacterized protein LY79DRAFT_704889 [Colletotrichum navitas]KAK1585242.1 hypothetical protein LY79DRAFT_704889 [Colletotrichum navitas]